MMTSPSFRIAALGFLAFAASSFAQSGVAFDRASSFRFPKIDFADASLEDASAFLTRTSRGLTPDKGGINIVIKAKTPPAKKINLRVTDMPAAEAVRYCAEAAGFSVTWMGSVAVLSDEKSVATPTIAFDGDGRGLFAAASKTILPKVDFRAATTREMLEFISAKTRLNVVFNAPASARPLPPSRQPTPPLEPAIKIAGLEPAEPASAPAFVSLGDSTVTFEMTNASVPEVLKVAALLTGATVRWDSNAVVFGPPGTESRPQIVNSVAIKGKVLMEKLGAIAIPKIDLRDGSLRESCDFLVRKLKEFDTERKGVNLLAAGAAADELVTLKLDAAPALEVLRYMAELTGTDLRIEHHALVFQSGK